MAVAIPITYCDIDDEDDGDDDDGDGDVGEDDDDTIQLIIEQNIALMQQVQLGKKIIVASLILMIIGIVIFIMNIFYFYT